MAAPKKEEAREEAEDWLTTFADAITLLMAFFVMLLTFSEFDIPAYEELASAVAANIGGKNTQSTTQSLKIDAQDLVYEMQADQVVTVGTDEKGVTIELQSNAFFLPGSADIAPAAIPVLKKLAETLSSPNYELYNVVVEGHTDDGKINTPKFASNWELSSGRASSVVRMFESNNVARERLKATGYADTRPKVPNLDLDGNPIPENRATNRRVVLRLHPMSLDERDAYIRAQEFKRRIEEAKAVAPAQQSQTVAAAPIEERLPIQPAPSALGPRQQETKAMLDNLKRDFITQYKAGEPKNINALDEWQLKFDNLAVRRDNTLIKDYQQIETFLNEERRRLTAKPAS
ncbi:MAG: OmpA family protein [Rhodospirillales bacterium]